MKPTNIPQQMTDLLPFTDEDFSTLCDDIEYITGGYDYKHVLDNPDYYGAHTVRRAKVVNKLGLWLLKQAHRD